MKRNLQPGRLSSTQRFLESSLGPVKQYIHQLPDLLAEDPSLAVLLLNRVSTKPQAVDGHLEDDRQWCLERLVGCNIVGQFDEVCRGTLGPHRVVLRNAIERARQLGAVLVVSSRERLIRAQGYDGTNASDVPGHDEYQALAKLGNGVTFATILRPTQRGRSFQIKRGQEARGNKGGRPQMKTPGWRKRLTKKKRPLVFASIKEGFSIRKAAAMHGVLESTARKWLKKRKNAKKKVRTQNHEMN